MNAGLSVWRKIVVFLWIVAAVLGRTTVQAQVRLGILGGLHSSNVLESNNLHGWDTAMKKYLRSQSGFQLGVIVEVPLGHAGFYFQPAITYVSKGRQYNRTNDSITALNTDTIYNKTSLKLGYIEIPLNVTYKIALTSNARNSFFISAGAYVAFFNSGNVTTQSLTTVPAEQFNSETDPVTVGKGPDTYKTVDIGLNGKAGFELGKIMLNLYYSRGLTSIYHADYPGTFHNTVFGASLGLWLTGEATPPPVKPRDTDKDGIPDTEDACPLKPGIPKYHGCPPPEPTHHGLPATDQAPPPPPPLVDVAPPVAPVLATIRPEDSMAINYIARNVLFTSSSNQFRDSSYAALDTLAARLLEHPEWHLTIEGHTDSSGIALKNLRLSQTRADAIRSYLQKKGVPANRLTAIGYGSSRPVADNRTIAGRAANRRVEFKLSIEGQ